MAERECQLTPEQLRRTFDPQALGIATTEHLQPLEWIIGQARAVSALRFGLGIQDIGFHVYVAGPPGSGKMTALRMFLEEVARQKEPPADWCYVYNFEDPYQPTACRLPAGQGRQLQQDMRQLIEYVRREIPKAFESEEYGTKQGEIGKALDRQRSQVPVTRLFVMAVLGNYPWELAAVHLLGRWMYTVRMPLVPGLAIGEAVQD